MTNAMPVVAYSPTDAELAKLKSQYQHLVDDPDAAKTPNGYEACRLALGTLVPLRTGVDKLRLQANADAQAFIKKNNAHAADITARLAAIEDPIRAKKKAVDNEKEQRKADELAAIKAKIEAEEKAKKDAEEARLKALRDAEDARIAAERKKLEEEKKAAAIEAARIAAEQAEAARLLREATEKAEAERNRLAKIESDRLSAERKKIEEEQAAARAKIDAERKAAEAVAQAERDRLAAVQKKIDDDRAAIVAQQKAEQDRKDREEYERQVKEKAEAAAKAKAEADRVAAEKAKAAKEEADRIEAERIATARPDVAKIQAFGQSLIEWIEANPMRLKTTHANGFFSDLHTRLCRLAEECSHYTTPEKNK